MFLEEKTGANHNKIAITKFIQFTQIFGNDILLQSDKIIPYRQVLLSFKRNVMLKTRRERLKSALYLRLKKRKTFFLRKT